MAKVKIQEKFTLQFRFMRQMILKVLLQGCHFNGHTTGRHPQTQKLELHTELLVPRESNAEEVSFQWTHHRTSSTDSKVRTTY